MNLKDYLEILFGIKCGSCVPRADWKQQPPSHCFLGACCSSGLLGGWKVLFSPQKQQLKFRSPKAICQRHKVKEERYKSRFVRF